MGQRVEIDDEDKGEGGNPGLVKLRVSILDQRLSATKTARRGLGIGNEQWTKHRIYDMMITYEELDGAGTQKCKYYLLQ